MNINEEDFTVASFATLVGSELNVIDKYTEGRSNGPANKLDPRTFLNKNFSQKPQNKNVIKHDGMTFYAGVDESLVQSMHPDVVSSSPQPKTISAATVPQQTTTPQSVAIQENLNQSFDKTLKSIDKTLKSIDKNQKLVLEAIKKINLNSIT